MQLRWILAACFVGCGGTRIVYQTSDDGGSPVVDQDAASSSSSDAGADLGFVHCGDASCAAGAQECCFTLAASACVTAGTCAGTAVACANPANCAAGQVCCSDSKLAVACKSSCTDGTRLCASEADCVSPMRCVSGLNGYRVCARGDGG